MMDIGIWMDAETLASKLEQQHTGKPEAAWNLSRWPHGFTDDPEAVHRLFIASAGYWVGYFLISPDMLYLPEDNKTPYVLLFDTRTWTELPRTRAKRFRGFTYAVPREISPQRRQVVEGPSLPDEAEGSGENKSENSPQNIRHPD